MAEQREETNILDKLILIQSSLPTKQEQLCSYILRNYQDIGLLTIKELADQADVGTTTVMRLIKAMGYDSFFELKKEFHRIQVNQTDKWSHVQKSFGGKQGNESYTTLKSVGKESVNLINKTINPQLVENFNLAMDIIENASKINLLGLRPYRAVAIYMELLIEEFSSNTRQLSYDSDAMFDRILQFKEGEVFILFAFTHYTQRTIDAAIVAFEQGVQIILITDHLSCPIAAYADVILKIEPSEEHFTIIPIITLVESIVIELGKRTSDTSIQKIKKLEEKLIEKKIILD